MSRNVGTKGHLRKEIVMLKYRYFRLSTKTGAHLGLLNRLKKNIEELWRVGGLEGMLEGDNIVNFTIPKDGCKNKVKDLESSFDCIIPHLHSHVRPVHNS